MKKIKFLLCFSVLLAFTSFADYPAVKEYVNDYAELLSDDAKTIIVDKLSKARSESGKEIVVVTIDSYKQYKTGALTLRGFATKLFNNRGIGSKNKNDGVLLLISKKDRKIIIELGDSYTKYHDKIMKQVIDDKISPALRNSSYDKGTVDAIDSIIVEVNNSKIDNSHLYSLYYTTAAYIFISLLCILHSWKTKKNNWSFAFTVLLLVIVNLIFYADDRRSFDLDIRGGDGFSVGRGASGDF